MVAQPGKTQAPLVKLRTSQIHDELNARDSALLRQREAEKRQRDRLVSAQARPSSSSERLPKSESKTCDQGSDHDSETSSQTSVDLPGERGRDLRDRLGRQESQIQKLEQELVGTKDEIRSLRERVRTLGDEQEEAIRNSTGKITELKEQAEQFRRLWKEAQERERVLYEELDKSEENQRKLRGELAKLKADSQQPTEEASRGPAKEMQPEASVVPQGPLLSPPVEESRRPEAESPWSSTRTSNYHQGKSKGERGISYTGYAGSGQKSSKRSVPMLTTGRGTSGNTFTMASFLT
ncbi:MAG: hypothetical protein M1818_000416 [Claussenomyces sp. TS43310]|nr:MAG: hypothetical protein M1818_000416 [Claussenomyces sp. TS43310]